MPKTAAPVLPANFLMPTLEVMDPEAITGGNIRDAQPDQEMLDSVRERWVHSPVGVLRTADGRLLLRFGDRRRKACIQLGYPVLAIVVEGTADTTEDEIKRILLQWDENETRVDLTMAEKVATAARLFELGANANTVKKMTGWDRAEIAKARKADRSDTARTLAQQYPLNLHQMAVLAEFDDEPETAQELAEAARDNPRQFDHRVERARGNRADAARLAARAAELTEQGVKVTSEAISYENGLSYWAGADGRKLDGANHKDCPGNVVVLHVMGYDDASKRVDESWYCTDPKAHGHKKHQSGQPEVSPEEARAERVRVREGNKDWKSATTVRQRWLKDVLLQLKTLPDGAALFAVKGLAAADSFLIHAFTSMSGGKHKTARDLLGGIEADNWMSDSREYASPLAASLAGASEQRAHMVSLALVIGAYESLTADAQTWRTPSSATGEYLTALAGWGYDLSPAEQAVIDALRAKAEAFAEAEAVDAAEVAARDVAEAAAAETSETGEG